MSQLSLVIDFLKSLFVSTEQSTAAKTAVESMGEEVAEGLVVDKAVTLVESEEAKKQNSTNDPTAAQPEPAKISILDKIKNDL